MRIVFIIDPLESLKPWKDTSLDLARIALARRHDVYLCGARDVHSGSGGPVLRARRVHLSKGFPAATEHLLDAVEIGGDEGLALDSVDVVFIRIDPPFDIGYLSLCLLLDRASDKPFFVNSPAGLRRVSEKLACLLFPEHIPATLVSFHTEELRSFAWAFRKVVLKPAFHGSGKGVVAASAADEDFEAKVAEIRTLDPLAPVIAQEFLPEIVNGDVRVMLLEGEPVAALGRVPAEGDFRANIAAGGSERRVELTDRQRSTAMQVGGYLRDNGVFFAGLDFIGDRLIEINVTSPTLIQELRRVGGPDVGEMIFDRLEAR